MQVIDLFVQRKKGVKMNQSELKSTIIDKIDTKLENTIDSTSQIIESLITLRANCEEILFFQTFLDKLRD